MAKKTKTKAVTLWMPPELHEQVPGRSMQARLGGTKLARYFEPARMSREYTYAVSARPTPRVRHQQRPKFPQVLQRLGGPQARWSSAQAGVYSAARRLEHL